MLTPILIVGVVVIIVFVVIVRRDVGNDEPTRRQQRAYERCMDELLPPLDENGEEVVPAGYVEPTAEQLRECEDELGG